MESFSRRQALKSITLGAAALAAVPALAAAADKSTELKPSEIGSKDGKFVLPPLPYEYGALEPAIDETTMRLHHGIHHAAYVKGANAALDALAAIAAGTGDASLAGHWTGQLAFNASGHALHTLFWNNLTPKGGGGAFSPELTEAIKADFGGPAQFEKLFTATATSVQGSGWAILGFEPLSRRLVILQAEKHQNLTLQGVAPLLALDVWEHAYYLKYQNKRADYVKAFLTIVNAEDVSARYAKAVAAK